jgi:hypothetical protein
VAGRIGENIRAGEAALKTRSTGPCHDVKPWSINNRVLLYQATLSIGLYLLLEGVFRRCGFTPPP